MFTTPSGNCHKPKEWLIILVNAVLVFLVFVAVDALFHFLVRKNPDPYTKDICHKLLYMFLLAAAYGHLYNKASFAWRPNSPIAFIPTSPQPEGECKSSWDKILNGLIFNILLILVLYAFQELSQFMFIQFLPQVFDFHGGVQAAAPGMSQAGTSIIIAGVLLEGRGHTEGDPR